MEVKVISGDNPLTVSEVAKEAGIVNAEEYVDATTLQTDEDIANAIAKYTVFGRVTPGQKRQFVQALKDQGKTVAMTGDGVNDVLALKDADCSVAMASGSDAACQAAQVVLLESNFACMPSVVLEGRRVVNNSQPVPGKEHFLIPVVPVLGCIYDELSITAVTDFTDQHVHHWNSGILPGIPAE